MRNVILIEEFPLVSIVMKELIENIYPGSSVHQHRTIDSIDTSESFQADVIVCDMYGDEQNQIDLVGKIHSRFHHTKKIFFSSISRPGLQSVVDQSEGLLVSRSMGYRDIMETICAFDITNDSEVELSKARNEFQSQIQYPGSEKPLTIKQLEVMELCIQGLSNKEIAREINLSPETVRAHLKQCYTRLQAKSRAQAVANFEVAKRLANRLNQGKTEKASG